MKKLSKEIDKLLEEYRLDSIIDLIQRKVPLDDLLLAFSNVCVFKAIDEEKTRRRNCKEYKEWMARASIFTSAIKDGRKATVLKRKIKKEEEIRKEEESHDSEFPKICEYP